MARARSLILVAVALLGLGLARADRAAAYETADLTGAWRFHSIASGPGAPWWERARLAVAPNGDFTATTTTNLGEADTVQATFVLSPAGVLTLDAPGTFRGAVDIGRTVLAATDTWTSGAPGTTELKAGVKVVGPYAPADLAGEWEVHTIASGPGAPWWMRGRLTVASDGSFTGALTDIDGLTEPASGAFGITSDGVVTLSVADGARGSLDAGRTVLLLTNTWTGYAAGTAELIVGVRLAGPYAQADLAGTWEVARLATGPGAPWWGRGQIAVAPDGSYSGTLEQSAGPPFPVSGRFVLAADGAVTLIGAPFARGALDAGRSVMVGTDTWTSGIPGTSEVLVATRTGGSTAGVSGPGPLEFALEPIHPNPLRGGVPRVRFSLAHDGPARLELLDVTGRRLASRDVGALGVGRHQVLLDTGARLVPGLYWVRLTQGADVRARHVATF
jgi:hypothetical protein